LLRKIQNFIDDFITLKDIGIPLDVLLEESVMLLDICTITQNENLTNDEKINKIKEIFINFERKGVK
jgi:hypothetical protein